MSFAISKFRGFLLAATGGMLVEYLMGLSDSIVAGNMLGESALAGVNLLQTPMNVVSFFACLFGTGTAICFSFEVGRFDRRRANEMFSQGLWSAVATGIALMVALFFLRDAFLDALGPSAEVRRLSEEYWTWYVVVAGLEGALFVLANACYADGDGKLCLLAYAVQLAGNVGLSILFARHVGMAGCSLGTLAGELLAFGVLAFHFRKASCTLAVMRHFSFRDLLLVVRSSFGDASTRLFWAGLFFLLNKYVIDHAGSDMLPVAGVVVALLGVTEAFNGVPNAAQPLVGVYAGERNVRGVRTVMRAAGKAIVLEGLGLSVLLLAFPGLALRMVGVTDPALVGPASQAVRLVAAGMVFWAIATLFNSYYLFIGREALACGITAAVNFVAPCALFPLGGAWFGLAGVWGALSVAPLAVIAVTALWLLVREGAGRFPLLLDGSRDARLHVFDLELSAASICRVSERVGAAVRASGVDARVASRAALLVEEVLMAVGDRNGSRRVLAEVSLDLNEGVSLVLRDDGEVFDITDADARISSLRTYLVASVMESQKTRVNLTTTGFNRNAFAF